jgi:Caspase domain
MAAAPAARSALVVATQNYADVKLRKLRATTHDASALARVLGDPEIGAFDVDVVLDQPEHVLRRRVAAFFKDRRRDDLLLLHFSCHGVKDEDGHLYFAAQDTDMEHLDATALAADFVSRLMNKSLSRRIVMLLDCCYSGAFGRGATARAGDGVELKERFEGRGRVVLTASTSMEYAYEGDDLTGEGQPSFFTSALVAGLETGDADRDGDGNVSVDDLYDYVFEHVRSTTPNQTPTRFVYGMEGELVVARSPRGVVPKVVPLPPDLARLIEDRYAGAREGAVKELRALLLYGTDPGLAASAREALERLVDDDSRMVSAAAAAALAGAAEEPAPPPPPPKIAKAAPAAVAPSLAPKPRERVAASAGAERLIAVAGSVGGTLVLAGTYFLEPGRGWFYRLVTLTAGAALASALAIGRRWVRSSPALLAVLLGQGAAGAMTYGLSIQATSYYGGRSSPVELLTLAAAVLLAAAAVVYARRLRSSHGLREAVPLLGRIGAFAAAFAFVVAAFGPDAGGLGRSLAAYDGMLALEPLLYAGTAVAAVVIGCGAGRTPVARAFLAATGVSGALYGAGALAWGGGDVDYVDIALAVGGLAALVGAYGLRAAPATEAAPAVTSG